MAHSLTDLRVRQLRLRAQRLHPQQARSITSVAQLLSEICGLQAQDQAAANLAVRARSAALTASDIERARLEERSIVRTWLMRGTLHLVAAEDVRWLLALLGPIFAQAGRRRRAQLGLDDDASAKGVRVIREALAGRGPLTRAEIAYALKQRGIPAEGQATIHLIGLAALQGIVCQGPERNAEPAYILLDDWIDRKLVRPADAGQVELARRFVAAYGPVGPDDLAYWSGLPTAQARTAWRLIGDELIEVKVAGQPVWLLESRADWLNESAARASIVRLLPAFDTYWLGYRDRAVALSPKYAKRVHPGGGIIHPALVVDGRARGTWRSKRKRRGVDVVVEPFEALPSVTRRDLDAEVADLARFLGVEATLSIAPPPNTS
jgi:hypothetical protein